MGRASRGRDEAHPTTRPLGQSERLAPWNTAFDPPDNEAPAEILCHNHCRLIPSHSGLGIVPVFWDDEPVEPELTGDQAARSGDDVVDMRAWI